MGYNFLLSSGGDIDFMIKGVFPYQLFDQTVWITTTHISALIVIIVMTILCFIANRVMKKATEIPGNLQSVYEIIVDMLDNFILNIMGARYAPAFRNYIGTIFIFILLSNTSGLFGLRNPTADYGTTLALGLLTFSIVNISELIYCKPLGYLKNQLKPMSFFLPLNIIGKLAQPISLSLRLFANNLSGIIMLAMIYVLLKPIAYVWPAFLHAFFDMFIGFMQSFVFCMLSMTYITIAVSNSEE
ncbi:MAG: F0F1 ATP synthase subunit A [Lachnospiraceae bacterium]|nr:F0F1 ATP synthase subunit A [Lachnospiraceae bacterium]